MNLSAFGDPSVRGVQPARDEQHGARGRSRGRVWKLHHDVSDDTELLLPVDDQSSGSAGSRPGARWHCPSSALSSTTCADMVRSGPATGTRREVA